MTKECNLVASLLPGLPSTAVSVSIAVPGIVGRAFYIIIDIGSLQHLREIHRHPVKDGPCLRVGTDMLVTSLGNSRCTSHQLPDHENNDRKDEYRHE